MSISTEEIKCYIREYMLIVWEAIKRFTKRHESQILCFIVGVLCGLLFLRGGQHRAEVKAAEVPQVVITEAEAKDPTAGQLKSMEWQAYKDMARVLYGVRSYNLSDTAKKAILDVIVNRVECTYGEFGNTICEVCNKEAQWQGFIPDGHYLQSDYELVEEYMEGNEGHILPNDCYYLLVGDGYVEARTTWDGGEKYPVR